MSNAKTRNHKTDNGAHVGYAAELWHVADAQCDSLLPKLVSSELQVFKAETLVEVTV
jgi:hypothetical protein